MEEKEIKALYAMLLKKLTDDIVEAKIENDKDRKLQGFIIERITVEMVLVRKICTFEWLEKGIDHYCRLGVNISRNDIMTQLTERVTELEKIKDPKKIKELLATYRGHQKEVIALLNPNVIIRPRF